MIICESSLLYSLATDRLVGVRTSASSAILQRKDFDPLDKHKYTFTIFTDSKYVNTHTHLNVTCTDKLNNPTTDHAGYIFAGLSLGLLDLSSLEYPSDHSVAKQFLAAFTFLHYPFVIEFWTW